MDLKRGTIFSMRRLKKEVWKSILIHRKIVTFSYICGITERYKIAHKQRD